MPSSGDLRARFAGLDPVLHRLLFEGFVVTSGLRGGRRGDGPSLFVLGAYGHGRFRFNAPPPRCPSIRLTRSFRPG